MSAVYYEDEKTVTVTAKENCYFWTFYIAYPGDSNMQQCEYIQVLDGDYAADGSVTKVIDVSMVADISEAEIGCVAYSFNETYYDMDYFLDKIGAELTTNERLNSMTQAEFNIRNNKVETIFTELKNKK